MYNTGVVQFLKNGATGHWIKSSSIVCSQNTESTRTGNHFSLQPSASRNKDSFRCVPFGFCILRTNKQCMITDKYTYCCT